MVLDLAKRKVLREQGASDSYLRRSRWALEVGGLVLDKRPQ